MMSGGLPRALSSRRGVTLLELLLALSIAVLISALVFSLYRTGVRALAGQQARLGAPAAAGDAVLAIGSELARSYACPAAGTNAFVLRPPPESGTFPELDFHAARPLRGNDDPAWFEFERLAYRVRPDDGAGKVALYCERQLLAGPGSTVTATNKLVGGIAAWRVQVFDGNSWLDHWPPAAGEAALPRAARLELELEEGAPQNAFRTEVWIPAGAVLNAVQ